VSTPAKRRSAVRVTSLQAYLLICAAALSCSVDERGLRLGGPDEPSAGEGATTAGTGASANDGGSNAQAGDDAVAGSGGTGAGAGGSMPSSSGAGGGGGGGGSPQPAPGCGDFNENEVPDCEETLVEDPTFDDAEMAWSAEPTLTQDWTDQDALGRQESGALVLLSTQVNPDPGTSMAGTSQCLVATGAQDYDFAAQVRIDGALGGGKAGINVWFYGSDGCSDNFLQGTNASLKYDLDTWVVARGQLKSPAATRSMLVRLVAVKPNAQESFKVLFDNVLVTKL
jgi:hypothetical protein